MKRSCLVFMAAAVVALSSFPSHGADALFADKVMAKGKGVEIKESELSEAVIALTASLAAQGKAITEADRAKIKEVTLERMIMTKLLSAKALPGEKAEAKKFATEYVDNVKKQMPSEEVFKRRLEANGMTYEQLLAKAEEEALLRKVVEREISSKIIITDEEAKKFYDENPEKFDQPEMVHASHILLTTLDPTTKQPIPEDKQKEKREQIDKLLKRAKAGEDFGALAKEFSEDIGSKARGGEYTFPRGKMVPEFEKVAFDLPPGQISDVVTTQYGFHIIKVLEKLPAKKLTYAEVSQRLKDMLQAQEVQKELPGYYEKLKKDAEVKTFLEEEKK